MTKTLKMYTWQGFGQNGQARFFLAATSQAEVARLTGAPVSSLFNLHAGYGRQAVIDEVTAQPGVVFTQPLDALDDTIAIDARYAAIKARIDNATIPEWLTPGAQVFVDSGSMYDFTTVQSVKGRTVTLANGKRFDGTKVADAESVSLGATYRAGRVYAGNSKHAETHRINKARSERLEPVHKALADFRASVTPAKARAAAQELLGWAASEEAR